MNVTPHDASKATAPAEPPDELDEEQSGTDGWTTADVLLSAGALLAFVASWEAIVWFFKVPAIVVPAPSSVMDALRALFVSGIVWRHLAITVTEILAGFSIGAVAALVLGCLVAQFRVVDRVIYPYIVAFQAVPKVALAPLLVIWFGFGLTSKIIMTAVIAFFPILVNTTVGLKTVEQDRIDLMISLKASRWQTFRYVRLPTALPFIFAGLDVGIVLSVIGAIVGEFVGANGGLGYLLLVFDADLKVASVFAILVILAAVGMILHSAVQFAQRRVVFWVNLGADRMMGV